MRTEPDRSIRALVRGLCPGARQFSYPSSMVRGRRLWSLGALLVGALPACLVFDGRVAIQSDEAGVGDSSAPKPDQHAGEAGRQVDSGGGPVDSGGDAGRRDATTSGTGTGTGTGRGTGSGTGTGGGSGSGSGIPCGNMTCAGGPNEKCCAKLIGTGTGWSYYPSCTDSCMDAGGYYNYECDDDDECPSGQTCCGFRQMGSAPPLTSVKCQTTCPTTGEVDPIQVCRLGSSRGCRTGTCKVVPGDLPPGYRECN